MKKTGQNQADRWPELRYIVASSGKQCRPAPAADDRQAASDNSSLKPAPEKRPALEKKIKAIR